MLNSILIEMYDISSKPPFDTKMNYFSSSFNNKLFTSTKETVVEVLTPNFPFIKIYQE